MAAQEGSPKPGQLWLHRDDNTEAFIMEVGRGWVRYAENQQAHDERIEIFIENYRPKTGDKQATEAKS